MMIGDDNGNVNHDGCYHVDDYNDNCDNKYSDNDVNAYNDGNVDNDVLMMMMIMLVMMIMMVVVVVIIRTFIEINYSS